MTRNGWLRLGAAVTLLLTLQGCNLSMQERERINLYLTCDDCAHEVLPQVVDIGWRALPRLEGALVGPHDSRVAFVRENAGRAFTLIPSPVMDSLQFVEAAVSAYTDAYQARSAFALAEIAESETAPGCFLRQLRPPVACWEQARNALEDAEVRAAASSEAYSPPVRDVIQEQLQVIDDQGHWWSGTRVLGTALLAVIGATVTVALVAGS